MRIGLLAMFLVVLGLCNADAYALTFSAVLLHPAGFTDSFGLFASAGSQVGAGYVPATGTEPHAVLWNGSAASAVELHPAGFEYSVAAGATDSSQVGYGGLSDGSQQHALLWTGTASSVVDLHPMGYSDSSASAASGSTQAGFGTIAGHDHALLWTGSAASVVDIHSSGFTDSRIYAIASGASAGAATNESGDTHAVVWTSNTAQSVVDLNPAGFSSSYASGISVNDQVGQGLNGAPHALLWHGTAASVVDLQPTGLNMSTAFGVSIAGQVGWASGASTGNETHAFLWNGSAASAIDLHSYLTGLGHTFISSSASGITDAGTIVGTAQDNAGHSYAILWTPESGVPGDYNNNGIVDAADYVVWRKNQGTTNTLPNDAIGGTIRTAQYDQWRAHFGQTAGSGSGVGANFSVPEPATLVIFLTGMLALCSRRSAKSLVNASA